jgi:triacylglycerol esterase/lipase EstA (alpha/beta hydrolase family)
MGRRLANEVLHFIDEGCSRNLLHRLSFVGHSLGGVIIRAALPHLEDLREKLHILVTLSAPHMGYSKAKNSLVTAGLWIYKKMI